MHQFKCPPSVRAKCNIYRSAKTAAVICQDLCVCTLKEAISFRENDSSGIHDRSVLQSDKCSDQAIEVPASLYKVNDPVYTCLLYRSPSQHD